MKGVIRGLIIGLVIVVIGIAVLIGGLALNGWKFGNSAEFTTETFTAEGENTRLNLTLNAGAVRTEFYDGDRVIIVYPSSKEYVTTVTEKNGTVSVTNNLKWYITCGISLQIPETVIKLPKTVAFDLTLDIDAGTVDVCGGTYGAVSVELDAGTFKTGEVSCDTFRCDLNAGTLNVTSLTCNLLNCDLDAGTVKFDRIDCPDVSVTLDAGSAKLAFTGLQEEYTISRRVSAGSCNVGAQTGTTEKRIDVDLDAGSVNITFGV